MLDLCAVGIFTLSLTYSKETKIVWNLSWPGQSRYKAWSKNAEKCQHCASKRKEISEILPSSCWKIEFLRQNCAESRAFVKKKNAEKSTSKGCYFSGLGWIKINKARLLPIRLSSGLNSLKAVNYWLTRTNELDGNKIHSLKWFFDWMCHLMFVLKERMCGVHV